MLTPKWGIRTTNAGHSILKYDAAVIFYLSRRIARRGTAHSTNGGGSFLAESWIFRDRLDPRTHSMDSCGNRGLLSYTRLLHADGGNAPIGRPSLGAN